MKFITYQSDIYSDAFEVVFTDLRFDLYICIYLLYIILIIFNVGIDLKVFIRFLVV